MFRCVYAILSLPPYNIHHTKHTFLSINPDKNYLFLIMIDFKLLTFVDKSTVRLYVYVVHFRSL